MAENKINTRIVLRNADLSAWETSPVALLKGELALARLSGELSNSYKVRIGTGDKTWAQLSDQGQLIIPAKNVEGLTEAIAALSTSYRECADISELSTAEALSTYVEGDIAVEKKLINGTLSSFCAYRFSKNGQKWMALDGNYDASNVYFASDLSLAGSWTQVGNITKSGATGTFATAGKSVKAVFEEIFDKTVQPTTGSLPTASVTLANAGWKEIGTTFSPSYTTTFNQGTYGTPWNSGTVKDGTTSASVSITDGTTTKTTASGSFDSFTVLSSTNYKLNGSMTYNAGTVAKDNKGNDSNPVIQHLSGTATIGNSTAVRGYFPYFYGFKTTTAGMLPSNPTSDQVKALTHGTGSTTYVAPTTGYTSSSGWYQLAIACDHSLNKKVTKAVNGNKVDVTIVKYDSAVTVNFGDGGSRVYDLFLCDNAAIADATTITVTWG